MFPAYPQYTFVIGLQALENIEHSIINYDKNGSGNMNGSVQNMATMRYFINKNVQRRIWDVSRNYGDRRRKF